MVLPRAISQSGRSPQALQQLAHVHRQRRLESHQLTAARMPEPEPARVKRLTRELNRPEKIGTVRVPLFTDERVTAEPRLQPNLIAFPGDEPDLDERRALERFDHLVGTDRFLGARIAAM